VALDAFHDEVEARVVEEEGVRVVEVTGPYAEASGEAATARRAAEAVLKAVGVRGVGVELRVFKGIPVGRGLGSSGASAAAAAVATARALGAELGLDVLVEAAGEGEREAAGQPHYDNVAASLAGGLTVVARDYEGRVYVRSFKIDAWFALVVPMNPVPEAKTKVMREVLPGSIGLHEAVRNFGRAAMIVAAAVAGDLEAMGRMMMSDEVVEPRRASLVPCYREVREAAISSGALGFSLSGAGPSMIALAESRKHAEALAGAMRDACRCCHDPIAVVARPAGGAVEGGRP
jgi:homoserine kinase